MDIKNLCIFQGKNYIFDKHLLAFNHFLAYITVWLQCVSLPGLKKKGRSRVFIFSY